MLKTLKLALNAFPTIPPSLRLVPGDSSPVSEVTVNLASLYHHYFLDAYGCEPPNPDPAQFEYLQFLLPDREYRVRGGGIGVSPLIRRNRSSELGQAFCRWFLHDHLNITYFANMEHVLANHQINHVFSGVAVTRTEPGDVPDYLCAESLNNVSLAEAKGSYSAVSFSNSKFASWRKQFERVKVTDSHRHSRKVKSYIVATRFCTENMSADLKSTLFAEDPETPGDEPLRTEEIRNLAAGVVALHYAGIAAKLNQPILAAALGNGFVVPQEIRFPVVIWEFQTPPLKGRRFVGGYYPCFGGSLPIRTVNGTIIFEGADPLRLDVGKGTFFGLEETIFRQIADVAHGIKSVVDGIYQFKELESFYSAISLLRDGSVIGPIDFFTPVESTIV